jgi:DNA polymerase III subunit delta
MGMLHVLHGEDDFTARETLAGFLNDSRYEYNLDRFDGVTTPIEAIRMACQTLPFLSEARLIVVEGLPKPRRESKEDDSASAPEAPAKGAKGKRGAKKPSAAAQARDFAASLAELGSALPASTTLVVFIPEALPKGHPLLAAAETYGRLHTFSPPIGPALNAWIAARARHEHVTLTPEAARVLVALTESSPRALANEIAKLATYAGEGGTVDPATVQLLVADSRQARVFDLTDALARGERATALSLAHELLSDGQPPLMIVSMVARQIRILVQTKDLAAQGKRPPEIASATGMAPFMAEKAIAQARRFTFTQLDAAQRACLDADTALKRSRMLPDLALDLLIAGFGKGI